MSVLIAALLTLGAPQAKAFSPQPAQHANLAVYPIFESSARTGASNYITLEQGLKSGTVRVVERESGSIIVRPSPQNPSPRPRTGSGPFVPEPQQQTYQQELRQSGSSQVNQLWVYNESGKKLLLLAGEMVLGGKQDRILERDAIVPPGKQPVNINVYCVEHDRWTYKGGVASSFGGGGVMPDLNVRGAAQKDRDQSMVWQKVQGTLDVARTVAPTKAYSQNFQNKDLMDRVEKYVAAITKSFPEDRTVGAIVAVNGRFIWVDRFASSSLFQSYWPKLVRSYAMEAIRSGSMSTAAPPYDEAARFAAARDGKKSYEVEENVSKLVRIEADRHVIYELYDVGTSPELMLHESKIVQ